MCSFSPKKSKEMPVDFNFPFQPYEIQQNLMRELYSIIENKQIGIFESPTGTGKSLTLTCGSLRWLLDHEELINIELNEKISILNAEIENFEKNMEKETNWIDSQFKNIQKKNALIHLKKTQLVIKEFEENLSTIKKKYYEDKKTRRKPMIVKTDLQLLETTIGIEEHTDEEDMFEFKNDSNINGSCEEGEPNSYKDTKIFFCSRTHSQLSQVVHEIKQNQYGSEVRCISLASRQNLCINPIVKKLNSAALINEKCLDMQKSSLSKITSFDDNQQPKKKFRLKKNDPKCPFKNQQNIIKLQNESLSRIHDIEDLVQKGKTLKACPYYASRAAIKYAQIVMLPYQILLHNKTRKQSGVDLENSIIIIDEAHNLLSAISQTYSVEISLSKLSQALEQISNYKMKYLTRFSSVNLLYIQKLLFVTKRLIKLCKCENDNVQYKMMKTHELMSDGEFFNINIYEILKFAEATCLEQKLNRFSRTPHVELSDSKENSKSGTLSFLKQIESQQSKQSVQEKFVQNQTKISGSVQKGSPIRPLLTFLESLTECPDHGRILIKYDANDENIAGLKFILLNTRDHFEDIIKSARSVIIAGGTMRPTEELTNQLFKNCMERVKINIFGHVVASDSVLPIVIPKGPTGKEFLFNFSNRESKQMITELGMTLLNISNVVPAGIVCFVGSYAYLEKIYSQMASDGILKLIEKKKSIFCEPKSTADNSVEQILQSFASAIKDTSKNGAILFSVVGGKMSEGINFSDDLGRCVIIIGLPYPNKNSPDLLEKIKYLSSTISEGYGNEYYENLCIKAVNQCIGRSVRHINDYAAVLLIDSRYSNDKIRIKLPEWISKQLCIANNFGFVQTSLRKFFLQRYKINV